MNEETPAARAHSELTGRCFDGKSIVHGVALAAVAQEQTDRSQRFALKVGCQDCSDYLLGRISAGNGGESLLEYHSMNQFVGQMHI